jgi:hypothetical protein
MTLSLSQADQYHLSVTADFPPHIKQAQLKVHFFLPFQLAENSDINYSKSFYQNLLQKQLVKSITPPSMVSIEQDLLVLNQTAYAKAADNVCRYRKALSHFVSDIRTLHPLADMSELRVIDSIIESFQTIHSNETALTDARLFKLANHQVIYYYYQSLLLFARQQSTKVDSELQTLIDKTLCYAKNNKLRVHHDTEEGCERLHNKLHIARKVINSPYKIKRKKLKNGELVEQIIFGLAAAFAMAFATGVAFVTQRAFGNFSTPFFFSLVLSYTFKDRIKELGRNYLMEKFSIRYFQHQFRFFQGNDSDEILNAQETFYRQHNDKLPSHIQSLLKRLSTSDATTHKNHLVYQRNYIFSQYKQTNNKEKFIDELTINLSKTLRTLPKILSTHFYQDDKIVRLATVHKIHTIHILVSLCLDGKTEFYQYRIVTSRKGIHGVYNISVNNIA